MTALFGDNDTMPFGRHKGKKMSDVPAIYLLWLYDKGLKHTAVKQYIRVNFETLKKQAGNKRIKI